MLINVDDCIVISLKYGDISACIHSLQNYPEKFNLTYKGDTMIYLGVDFKFHPYRTFDMRQAYMIPRVFELVGLHGDASGKPTPASLPLLHKDVDGMKCHQKWD